MEKAEALWRSRIQAEKEEKEEAARRRRQAEVNGARWELVRLEQQRSPDIDPGVRPVLLFRAQNAVLAAVAAATTKACSAGCGRVKHRAAFSKKQWSARAVRRCLDCVQAGGEPKICAHGKGAFDCAACISIVTREAEAEAKAEALWQKSRAAADEEDKVNTKYAEAVSVAAEECAEDVKGQTCYICTQALHWKTKEGLVRMCACRGTAGFAHVSCLAEQAKILVAEAKENNLDHKVKNERWARWYDCSLCEQEYHGVVLCALGWACWKTYVGRPETDSYRCCAMGGLGQGLESAGHYEDALTVREALLSTERRVGASEESILVTRGGLANTYSALKRDEEAMSMRQGIYSAYLELYGEDHGETLRAANNYASTLLDLGRLKEARSLLRKTISAAQRVLGEGHRLALKMRWNYAKALYKDDGATLDDLREAVGMLEDTVRTGQRVFGGAHPITKGIEFHLRKARAALRARETPPRSA